MASTHIKTASAVVNCSRHFCCMCQHKPSSATWGTAHPTSFNAEKMPGGNSCQYMMTATGIFISVVGGLKKAEAVQGTGKSTDFCRCLLGTVHANKSCFDFCLVACNDERCTTGIAISPYLDDIAHFFCISNCVGQSKCPCFMQDIFVDSLLQKADWNEICIWRGGASGRPGRLLDRKQL